MGLALYPTLVSRFEEFHIFSLHCQRHPVLIMSMWYWLLWLWVSQPLLAYGSEPSLHPSSSEEVIEDQFSCLADYLHQKDPRKVDIYVQASLTGEFTVVFVVARLLSSAITFYHAKSVV